MGMEITNSYSSAYAAQNQQVAKQQTTGQQEAQKAETKGTSTTKKTGETKKSSGTVSSNDAYLNKLAKLAPSVEFRIGGSFASDKTGKTLTINPKLLEKMQNDPEKEREMIEMIKGVESMTKLSESINNATGWKTVFRHSYIDENGKYCHIALVRNEFGYKMSEKLREERRKNSEKLIEKTKEKAAKKKEELKELLEKKRAEKAEAAEEKEEKDAEKTNEVADEKTGRAEELIKEKVAASEDGMIYVNDSEMREILEAIKEDDAQKIGKSDKKDQPTVGGNLDVQV